MLKLKKMARFSRLKVLNTIHQMGLMPLYYNEDAEKVKQVVKASYKGGARVFEFTNRGDFAHEVFGEVNKWIRQECPEMILGVGSVVDAGTAALYIQLGANFIVSPMINPEVAKTCNRRKIPWMPGCGTLTEINNAEELGVEIVKIFPGEQVGGPAFVKAVKAPNPWTSIMPTGGVSPDKENLKAWFDAGVSCVGIGSKLFPADKIAADDFGFIEEKIRETLQIITKLKTQ